MISIRVGLLVTLTALAQSQNTSRPAPSAAKNPAQIEFVKISSGEFMMGCVPVDKDCLEDEVPRHKVQLIKGFQIFASTAGCTQAQWVAVMGPDSNPSKTVGPNNPVDSVDKADIHAFLDKLNAPTGWLQIPSAY